MGYSEIHCHLCGVSFNVARIRTPKEPRSYAWDSNGTKRLSFVSAAEYSFVSNFCGEDAGCQIAFREDLVPSGANVVSRTYSEVLEQLHLLEKKQNSAKEWPGQTKVGGMDDEFGDPDFASQPSNPGYDDESMDYEFEEPPEECDKMSIEGLTSFEEDLSTQAVYRQWLDHDTIPDSTATHSVSKPNDAQEDREHTKAVSRMASIMISNSNKELMLPLYKLSNFVPGDYLEPEIPTDRQRAGSPPKRDFSYINHRLNVSQPSNSYELDDAEHWEHIAGPDCTQPRGYNGTKITFEEMKSICTSQCLYQDYDQSDGSSSSSSQDPTDPKQAPNFTLSGLCFSMPSRDWATPAYDDIEYAADNHIWSWSLDDVCPPAIPFHPACLEVYKRACLDKLGDVNLTQLGGWWRVVNVDYDDFYRIPRDEAVARGREQWWYYEPGDEWLAANPCLIPELKRLVDAATVEREMLVDESGSNSTAIQQNSNIHSPNAFMNLPDDIHKIILDMLPAIDLANISLGVPMLRSLVEPIMRSALLLEYPYLWELWCDLKYPVEVGMSGIEDRLYKEAATPRNEEARRISEVLREDGFDAMANKVEEQHTQAENTLQAEFMKPVFVNEVTYSEVKRVDYIYLALALHQGLNDNRLKGLRNRARIWKDCNWILGDIDMLKQEGKLLRDGKISFETWREIQDQSA